MLSCANLLGWLPLLQEEICKNEDNIEHFHQKSVEIQEMLQSQEAPLELQVSAGEAAAQDKTTT